MVLGPYGFDDFCLQPDAGEEMSPMPSSNSVDAMDQNTNSVIQHVDSAAQCADSMDQC